MLRNYIRIAICNLTKHKSFSFINIFGLALGTACCLYILPYVRDEIAAMSTTPMPTGLPVLGSGKNVGKMATTSPPIPFTMAVCRQSKLPWRIR